MRGIACSAMVLAAASLFAAEPSYAGGNCYHQIQPGLCKGGYASGYNSDCSTPCSTGFRVKNKSVKHVHRVKTTRVVKK